MYKSKEKQKGYGEKLKRWMKEVLGEVYENIERDTCTPFTQIIFGILCLIMIPVAFLDGSVRILIGRV